jgi:hypothetical protein
VITAVLAVCAAAAVIVALGSYGTPRGRTGTTEPKGGAGSPARTARTAPTSGPPATPREAPTFAALPPPCGTVGRSTVDRLVTKARVEQAANTTLGTCTYSSAGARSQWLRVETRIFDPIGGTDAAATASGFFGAQWTRTREDPMVRVVSMERQDGMGDDAYRVYKMDKGQPTVVGEVAVRLRNAVITVSYSGVASAPARSDANERKYVSGATTVAREVLTALK